MYYVYYSYNDMYFILLYKFLQLKAVLIYQKEKQLSTTECRNVRCFWSLWFLSSSHYQEQSSFTWLSKVQTNIFRGALQNCYSEKCNILSKLKSVCSFTKNTLSWVFAVEFSLKTTGATVLQKIYGR